MNVKKKKIEILIRLTGSVIFDHWNTNNFAQICI